MDLVLVSITALSLVLALTMGSVLFRVLREERRRSDARVALLAAAAGQVFVPAQDSRWGRGAAAAGVALLVVIAGYALLPRTSGRSGDQAHSVTSPQLELLALRHAREENGLTISGVVQNPPTGRAITGAVVTAALFDAEGALLAVGRSGVDQAVLAPGDESPFVIQVPVAGVASRYRVSFRGPDGAVIAHVDRRVGGAAARNSGMSGSEPWIR
jgi:hypothetical protein